MAKKRKVLVGIGIKGAVSTLFLLLALTAAYSHHCGTIEVGGIEMGGELGERIVTLRFTEAVNYRSFTLRNPPRVVLDIPGVTLKEPRTIEMRNEVVETISYRQHQPDIVRLVVNLTQLAESRVQKVGRELRLHLSLPREVKARLQNEERARQLLVGRVKRETELKAGKVASEKERVLEIARQEVRERERQLLTYLNRGGRHLRAQRFDEAVQEFKAVLALDPGNEKAQHYLILTGEGKNAQLLAKEARSLEEKARWEEEQRQQAVRRQEEEREQRIAEHLRRGREYYLKERYAEAISEGKRMLALSPHHRSAEDLIMQSRRGDLERDKRRAWEEREMVEERRILDVTRAAFIGDPDLERDREMPGLVLEDDPEEVADTLRKRAEEMMVTMDFRATDIREVLLHLARLSEVTIAVDERALRELVDPDVTIFTPSPIPLTDALGIVLRVKGLGYVIREHYIWVAEAGREEEAVTRIFPLRYGIRRIREVGDIFRDDDRDRDRDRDRDGDRGRR